jgi:hypothetical protein
VTTASGCHCSNNWSYNSKTYSGTCKTGLDAGQTSPLIAPTTNWCYIDKDSCPAATPQYNGYAMDYCTPAAGRVTESGSACQFPVKYHNVWLHDCIDYDHSVPGTTVRPWCYINATQGTWDYCAPAKCSQKLPAGGCPALPLTSATFNTSSWTNATYDELASAGCLTALCGLRNNPLSTAYCPNDSQQELTAMQGLLQLLDGSSNFTAALNASVGRTSLAQHCRAATGDGCIANTVAPACPRVQYSTQLRRYVP